MKSKVVVSKMPPDLLHSLQIPSVMWLPTLIIRQKYAYLARMDVSPALHAILVLSVDLSMFTILSVNFAIKSAETARDLL